MPDLDRCSAASATLDKNEQVVISDTHTKQYADFKISVFLCNLWGCHYKAFSDLY